MRRWILILAVVWAAGPAVGGEGSGVFDREGWAGEVRQHGLDPAGVVYPFEVSNEMILWVDEVLSTVTGIDETVRLDRLQDALFAGGAFDFGYDEDRTLTAREAFAERRGNCLSFTVLFVALSRSVGVETFLVDVEREPEVDRVDDLVIVNRHVVAGHRTGRKMVTYDFAITSDAIVSSRQVIDDVRASAMYHANLGGQALRDGDPTEALHHMKIATVLAPDWAPGWVNLGVALARLDRIDDAFGAYKEALDVDPNNASAMNNMSALFARLGRTEEARAALRAAAERTESPFTLIAIADAEMVNGRFDAASRYLRRAKRWHPKVPEVYEALARLAEATDDPDRAAKHRDRAQRLRLRQTGG